MISIDFDDIIYSLQSFGGGSVYWNEITGGVSRDPRFSVRHRSSKKFLRGIPALSKADIFHSSHFRHCISPGTKVVSTVHDLTYELGFAGDGWKSRINTFERKHSYFLADALICISASTKQELLDIYPQLQFKCPIYVIHHGFVEFSILGKSNFDPLKKYGPYVLYVGGRAGYKNFRSALKGFYESKVWKDGVKLLCTGAVFNDQEIEEISILGLHEAVISLGKVSAEDLSIIYENAHCLLYTSLKEGFGLPLLEAMSKKCPVIACNTSCMPEVADKAALLVKPMDIGEISTAILNLQDTNVRRNLIELGLERVKHFSWEKSIQGHIGVYLELSK